MRDGLLLTLVFAAIALHAAPSRADSIAVERLVARKAAILELLHAKAEKALVTLAQDDSYAGYFATQDQAERARLKARIDQISLRAQSRFHVEEMCLIDPSGTEVSRIVGGHAAHDLSDEEASAIFFAPGFALAPRTVYVSPAYLSPDADKWVIAYVTPIIVEDKKRAILHYEHNLGVYQDAVAQGLSGNDAFIVAVTADGRVVADSRRPIPIEKRGDSEDPADYFEAFAWQGFDLETLKRKVGSDGMAGSATLRVDGVEYDIAYRIVHDWTLVGIGRQ